MPISVKPEKAKASPGGDARRPRLNDVRSVQGLPAPERSGLKKRAQQQQQQQQQQKQHQRLRVATINIGTLTSRTRELSDALKQRRVDIACIQETKWKGAKAKDIGEGYKLFYYGQAAKRNGVGIAINQRLRDCVVDVNRISDRLISIKIEVGTTTIRVVSCYAPQTGCPADEKDEFWNTVDAHLREINEDEYVLVGGDLNGHVGATRQGYHQQHGGHGIGVRNEEGIRILECAEAHDLAIANTYFKKRPSHLITYQSGPHSTQIDYWLIRRCHLKLALDSKVIPSDNIAPQHHLLVLDLRISTKRKPNLTTKQERIKWWKLSSHKEHLATKFNISKINYQQPADDIWKNIADHIQTTASEILGKTKPGRPYIDKQVWWWNHSVQDAIKAKKKAFKAWRNSRNDDDRQRYKTSKTKAKQAVATAKAHHYKDLYDRLDTPEGANGIYRLSKSRHRASLDIGHVIHVKDEDHRILREPPAILERWRQYFHQICNEEFPYPLRDNPTDPVAGPVPQISITEVMTAIQTMKNGKATGPDDIPAEVWKLMDQQGAQALSILFNRITADGTVPHDWTCSTTVPIWKNKGDVLECSNYRPIRLLSHTMKIFERVLDARIRQIVDITPNQCGFVKGCGTTDAIHATRLLMERHREKNRPLHLAFLDLEKAFDRVPHDLIWRSLRAHGVPETYVQWVQMLYKNTTTAIRSPAGTSRPLNVTVGVHQGSALSPLLFILCMNIVTRAIQTPHPWTLLYADDVMIATETTQELEQLVQQWNIHLQANGLRLNISKTEYLETGQQTNGTISVEMQELRKVDKFKYLGSVICADGDTLPDARSRTNAAWLKWRQVTGVLCDRRIPTYLKSKIYKTVVRPVALYGAECWPVTTRQEQMLHVTEMRMLRWSLGLTRLDHARNDNIRKTMGVAPITAKMREQRLRWYGHVVRKDENSVARKALSINPHGKRHRGRPKKRWLDRLREDMRQVGVTEEDAFDRTKWRSVCKTADPAPKRETR